MNAVRSFVRNKQTAKNKCFLANVFRQTYLPACELLAAVIEFGTVSCTQVIIFYMQEVIDQDETI